MSVLSARKASIFWRLRLPSSLPYVFAGLRVAATLSVIGSIVAEFTGADRGIGFVIVQASYRIDTRLMFAAITLSSLAGIVFFHLIGWIESGVAGVTGDDEPTERGECFVDCELLCG